MPTTAQNFIQHEKDIEHLKNNFKTSNEFYHGLDKRVDGVERECAFFNNKLIDDSQKINARLDRIEDSLSDFNDKLDEKTTSINEQLSDIKVAMGEKRGTSKMFKAIIIVIYSLLMLFFSSTLQDILFKHLGIK